MTNQSAVAAQRVWNNSGTDFNSTANWTGGVVPSGNNVAAFDAAEVTQPNLSASLSISGFCFSATIASGYDITSSGGAAFTLTGQTNGSTAQTTNSNSAAIFAGDTSGTNTIEVNLTLAPASGTISSFNQVTGGTLVVNGIVSGSGITLNLPGGGTLQLNGANTYSGGTTVNSGTLQIGNNSALGTSTLTFGSSTATIVQATGGARTISNDVVWGGNATIGGSNDLTINGSVTNSGSSRTLTISNGGTTTFGGSIFLSEASGTGRTLTITGAGNLVLGGTIANFNGSGTAGSLTFNSSYTGTATISGTNTYSGATTLSNGTFILGNKAAFGTSSVAVNGVSISANTNLSGSNSIANTVTFGGNNTFSGTNNVEFSGGVTDTGTRTITNNISSGTLTLSGGVNLSSNANNFTLTINGSGNTIVNSTVANGGTSTASNLTYSGTGTLTLSGANTYSGATTVNGGTLLVNGSTAVGSAVTVNSGGTLGGTGTVNGTVTVNGTGIVDAGPKGTAGTSGAVGTLHTGALTLASTSTFHADAFGTAAANWDQLVVNGLATLGSAQFQLAIATTGLNFIAGTTYVLIDANTISGSFSNAMEGSVVSINGYDFTAHYDAAGGNFDLIAIPEPGTWFAAVLALAAIGLSQRKRLRVCALFATKKRF